MENEKLNRIKDFVKKHLFTISLIAIVLGIFVVYTLNSNSVEFHNKLKQELLEQNQLMGESYYVESLGNSRLGPVCVENYKDFNPDLREWCQLRFDAVCKVGKDNNYRLFMEYCKYKG